MSLPHGSRELNVQLVLTFGVNSFSPSFFSFAGRAGSAASRSALLASFSRCFWRRFTVGMWLVNNDEHSEQTKWRWKFRTSKLTFALGDLLAGNRIIVEVF
jgi:hypothetical protein